MKIGALSLACIVCLAWLIGCATPNREIMSGGESQVALRSVQTRAFDTKDKNKTLRTVIATLQDLDFVIDKADETLGTVSATKLNAYALRVTVTVRPRGETQMLVRANAQIGIKPINDAAPYQEFFTALSKAMFLEAHQAD